MQAPETTADVARALAVCNACRYCEQYCPAFQALEQRLNFATADVNYLANLCHGCGECLYACQYAPPHEFAIDVPRMLAAARVRSYEQYAWPAAFGRLFRAGSAGAVIFLAIAFTFALLGAITARGAGVPRPLNADFYAVISHGALVALFGGVGVFVLLALAIGCLRAARDFASAGPVAHRAAGSVGAALRDALTLRHLHVAGADCATSLETRTPWRRIMHQLTAYGFGLCFASTCAASLYHLAGQAAPYAYTSVPVLLGTIGGGALAVGTAGLLWQRRTRDRALTHDSQQRIDTSFTLLLLLTGLSGLALLALRGTPALPELLAAHLGLVLALFVTLPYGKFVHGLYRFAALLKYRREQE